MTRGDFLRLTRDDARHSLLRRQHEEAAALYAEMERWFAAHYEQLGRKAAEALGVDPGGLSVVQGALFDD